MHTLAKVLSQTASQGFFPWLRKVPFINWYMNIEAGKRSARATKELFSQKIEQHEKTLNAKNVRDFIDMYLLEMKAKNSKNQDTTLSLDRLVGSVADLFGAGTITVKIQLLWCVYVMAAFPDIQKRVQKEIESQFGPERKPEFRDAKLLPYTSAVILEITRWKTIVPIPFLRYTTKDTTVRGFNIPKGTTVMENLYHAHHDPKLWSNPKTFMPERFLSEDGQKVIKSPNLMPFSVGKRACPGDVLANMEVFLYFVSMLQKFDITFPPGFKPTFSAKFTVAYILDPFKVLLTPRNS
ncbi:hypothetical protein JTE90_015562 [Oedothorax gibbosus]|nr:hypothetical protein JTE90_015562 [Oedothorax gibbosus]